MPTFVGTSPRDVGFGTLTGRGAGAGGLGLILRVNPEVLKRLLPESLPLS